jgi:hypothetical protein
MNDPEAVREAFSKVDKSSKLMDMKLPLKPKVEEATKAECPVEPKRDNYPYGLQLRFEQEQVDKIPKLKTFKVGDQVTLTGKGEVIELRMREEQGGKESWTVEVQIKKVDVVKGG